MSDEERLAAREAAETAKAREAQKSRYDDRTDRAAILATNCLGCNCAEGSFHAKTCPWYKERVPPKLLTINICKLIEQYGLRPRWATLDREGNLTIAGHSKEA